ncbi:hypothetical protein Tco_0317950 [Tanacetum coccineum]
MTFQIRHQCEDKPLGGSFHASHQCPSKLPKLQKVNSLEVTRKTPGHQKLFKDVNYSSWWILSGPIIPTEMVPTCVLLSSDRSVSIDEEIISLMVEEDITVKERTLKQMEDDRLGEEAAKRLHDEEQAQVETDNELAC